MEPNQPSPEVPQAAQDAPTAETWRIPALQVGYILSLRTLLTYERDGTDDEVHGYLTGGLCHTRGTAETADRMTLEEARRAADNWADNGWDATVLALKKDGTTDIVA